jgi:predicted RNase H-like HicB family nuclease
MRYYIGIIHKESDSDFGISFPDFPGCVSAGSDLDDVLSMGREALAGHMGLMADEGHPVPEPSGMDTILADPDYRDGTPVLVPAPVLSSKVVRVNITLQEDALAEIDRYAEAKGYSRSGFLVAAAKRAMEAV